MASESSSCSSSSSRSAYDVFLSFRGEDTRKNFTDHLYAALVQAGIHTFRDDDEIPRGGNIETEIKKAIQESKASVIVLSKDYASSRWCLDELVMIMERKRCVGHLVVPVFYDVGPAQVGTLTGFYGEAFARHEIEFKEEIGMVEAWREALREVAEMRGMIWKDRYLSQFIHDIVKEVGSKLKRTLLNVAPYLVGIESRIADINLWLQDGSDDVELAVIHGVGGIGKTTVAKTVYNQNFDKFEARSFLSNIREISEQQNGLVRLQRQLLSDVLKGKVNKIYNVDEGITKIKDAVCYRRVLLVLDDVDQLEQFNAIIGMRKWVCRGSKIIVTTRYENLLRAQGVCRMFSIKELDNEESLKLFSWHAFGKDHPVEGYMQLSESAMSLCSGLPLALQVLGTSLSGKSEDVWQSAIEKLEAIPDSKIQKILKVSYDSLQDDHDKNIFLDIACFFSGMGKDYVVTVLNGCGFYTVVGIYNLIARCLVTINEDNKLMMHQMLRDMGREIVRQESPDDPGKRSRLWRHKDAFTVLQENSGTSTIKGLTLSMQMAKESNTNVVHTEEKSYGDSIDQIKLPCLGTISNRQCNESFFWLPKNGDVTNKFNGMSLKTKAFASMDRLKLLQLNYVKLRGDFEDFPKSLVWLRWLGFPFKSIPNSFHLENLVALDMRNGNLINAWRGKRFLVKLKFLNLSHCHGLVKTPDFVGVPSLERLKLKGCINLVEVDESIGRLQKLILLNLKDCKNLKKLPGKISSLKSLRQLNLSGCSKLHYIPQGLERMELLEVLHSDHPSSRNARWYSTFRSWLLPRDPQSVTFSLALLPCSLVNLQLADCNLSDVASPNDLSCLCSLENLDLRGNRIHNLPESINNLTTLQYLCLDRCTSLQSLPELPTSLEELKAEGCTSLQRITNLPNLLRTLQVELFGCEQLVEVEGMFKLESLINIDAEMMNDLGLFDFEALESTEMTMFSTVANRERKTPPQVLHECGIFSFFLKGNEVPSWFNYKGTGPSVSFEMVSLPGQKIRGLNVCTLYARDYEEFWLHGAGHYAKIHNVTKGITWSYSPTFYAIPEDDDDMLWLSHWNFRDELEAGDEVSVFVRMPLGFYVKDCGIRIMYEQEDSGNQEDGEDVVRGSSILRQNIADIDLPMYQVGEAAYFLHHHPFTTPSELLTEGRMTAYF